MLKMSIWLAFQRGPSREELQSIEDRLQFLADVLPRYRSATDLDAELDDLDLDLNTFLGIRASQSGLTPWLVHSDWLGDVEGQVLDDESRSLVSDVLDTAAPLGALDLSVCLKQILRLLDYLRQTEDEVSGIASLAALDEIVYLVLAAIGLRRIRRAL